MISCCRATTTDVLCWDCTLYIKILELEMMEYPRCMVCRSYWEVEAMAFVRWKVSPFCNVTMLESALEHLSMVHHDSSWWALRPPDAPGFPPASCHAMESSPSTVFLQLDDRMKSLRTSGDMVRALPQSGLRYFEKSCIWGWSECVGTWEPPSFRQNWPPLHEEWTASLQDQTKVTKYDCFNC